MTRSLQTVQNAVQVLEAFDADHIEWNLSALAEYLQEPTSTLHEQLSTLTQSGLLQKVGRGKYRLGWRLLKLSSALYGSVPWYGPAHDAMNALARGTHVLAFLCVLEGQDVLCVARSVQGREGESVAGETQFVLPPHATASGKLLYALHGLSLPTSPQFTSQTGLKNWEAEAAQIRKTHLASVQDEWSLGSSGLAAPVLGADGRVAAALGLSYPSALHAQHEGLQRRLLTASQEVSWQLGFRGNQRGG